MKHDSISFLTNLIKHYLFINLLRLNKIKTLTFLYLSEWMRNVIHTMYFTYYSIGSYIDITIGWIPYISEYTIFQIVTISKNLNKFPCMCLTVTEVELKLFILTNRSWFIFRFSIVQNIPWIFYCIFRQSFAFSSREL